MVISNEKAKARLPELAKLNEVELSDRLQSLESFIRAYTHNNFQIRSVRFQALAENDKLDGVSPCLQPGDTLQVSQSGVNDGLYTVKEVQDDYTVVDRPLFSGIPNLVTLVRYPPDLIAGVIKLLKWDMVHADKVGIKSESLSRYSVTYYDQDSNNQVGGYPISLVGFLKPYKKARC